MNQALYQEKSPIKFYEEKPQIKPFLQNTLNPSGLEELTEHFKTGWLARYNTVQTSVYRK